MADSNSTECIEIDRVSWNKKRKGICLDGVWELDKIARTLAGSSNGPDLVYQLRCLGPVRLEWCN